MPAAPIAAVLLLSVVTAQVPTPRDRGGKATEKNATGNGTPEPRPTFESAPPPPDESPTEAFDRGRIAFGRGEYARAVQILQPLIFPEILLDDEGHVVQAHRMLGVALLFEDRSDEARQQFLRLLELRPDYRFDPLLDPPRVVDFFGGLLRERQAEIAAMEEQRRRAEDAERQRQRALAQPPRVVERYYERNSFIVNFVPFGAGQFQNGQHTKGWGFLAAESILASVSLGAFITNFAIHGVSSPLPCRDDNPIAGRDCAMVDTGPQERSELLTQIQVVSGGLFLATVAWGITDALVHYQPVVPVERPGSATLIGRPSPPPRAAASLTPLILPAARGQVAGAALHLRF